MKKLFCIIITLIITLGLTACKEKAPENSFLFKFNRAETYISPARTIDEVFGDLELDYGSNTQGNDIIHAFYHVTGFGISVSADAKDNMLNYFSVDFSKDSPMCISMLGLTEKSTISDAVELFGEYDFKWEITEEDMKEKGYTSDDDGYHWNEVDIAGNSCALYIGAPKGEENINHISISFQ